MAPGYRTTTNPDHPLAMGCGRIYEHRQVLFDKIGAGPHFCHWCGRLVGWGPGPGLTRLVTDHLNDDKLDNSPGNLVPSCVRCNSERARRPDFLTHCLRGHEWTSENTYFRPDTGSRQCKKCALASTTRRRNATRAGGAAA